MKDREILQIINEMMTKYYDEKYIEDERYAYELVMAISMAINVRYDL